MENQVKVQIKVNASNTFLAVEIEQLDCFVMPKGNGFIASCKSLKSIGFSNESKEAAQEDLKRAINVFFKVHVEAGTLFQALERFGFKSTNLIIGLAN